MCASSKQVINIYVANDIYLTLSTGDELQKNESCFDKISHFENGEFSFKKLDLG